MHVGLHGIREPAGKLGGDEGNKRAAVVAVPRADFGFGKRDILTKFCAMIGKRRRTGGRLGRAKSFSVGGCMVFRGRPV
jgi:hypothetical protein